MSLYGNLLNDYFVEISEKKVMKDQKQLGNALVSER